MFYKVIGFALHHPKNSSWMQLLSSGNDQTLITLTGFGFSSFDSLVQKFKVFYDIYTPLTDNGHIHLICGVGQPCLMNARDSLGMNLAWMRLRGSTIALQMIFRMKEMSISMYLKSARRLLIHILNNHQILHCVYTLMETHQISRGDCKVASQPQ